MNFFLTQPLSFQVFSDIIEYLNYSPPSSVEQAFLLALNLKIVSLPSLQAARSLYNEIQPDFPKKKWNIKEKTVLSWIVFHYLFLNKRISFEQMRKRDWQIIGSLLGKNYIDCVFKFMASVKSNVQKIVWDERENQLLSKIVNNALIKPNKLKWINIAQDFYRLSDSPAFRNEKMCREHWISHLNPNLNRNPWTEEEDLLLLAYYLNEGSKWSFISMKLQGRNPYAVKNRFYSICNKKGIHKESNHIEFQIENLIQEITSRRKKIKANNHQEIIILKGNSFDSNIMREEFEEADISSTIEGSENNENLFEKYLSF